MKQSCWKKQKKPIPSCGAPPRAGSLETMTAPDQIRGRFVFKGCVTRPLHRERRRRLDFHDRTGAAPRSLRSEFLYRRDQRVDIAAVGTVIDDGRAYRELAVENGGRRRGDPGFLDVDDNAAIDLVGI